MATITGMITAIAGPAPERTWAYAYDDLGRLITANARDTTLDQTFRGACSRASIARPG